MALKDVLVKINDGGLALLANNPSAVHAKVGVSSLGAVPKVRLGQPRLLSIRRVMERLGVFPKQMTVGSPVISRLWQPTLSDYVLYTAAPIRR